jgi:hypothetical protein
MQGKSDVVVVTSDRYLLSPVIVKFAIEIKKPATSSSGYKEAICQLLGLNIGNPAIRPLVVLTDLVLLNETFELFPEEEPDGATKYALKRLKFQSFADAVTYADAVAALKLPGLFEFCRGPSPRSNDNVLVGDEGNSDDMRD